MLEIVTAVVVTALVMLIPLREVNIRRLRAWAARDLSVQGQARADEAFSKAFAEEKRDAADATAAALTLYDSTLNDLQHEHQAAIADQAQVHALSYQASHIECENRDLHISNLKGEIIGLNAAHEETKVWADLILRDHAWHIGGKADPHEKGTTLIRYECPCGAVTHAPEGSL